MTWQDPIGSLSRVIDLCFIADYENNSSSSSYYLQLLFAIIICNDYLQLLLKERGKIEGIFFVVERKGGKKNQQ